MEMQFVTLAPLLGAIVSLLVATTIACFFESLSED